MNKQTAWIRNPAKYAAYVERTTEKDIFKGLLAGAYYQGKLPIKPGDKNKKVLDLGCGLGSLTVFLSALFKDHDIYAVERSKSFLDYAEQNVPNAGNINFYCQHFEDYSNRNFDFILCSHVLQYIDSPIDEFLLKLYDSLTVKAEAWIVLQEDKGINQVVKAAIPHLNKKNPYIENWFVHEYVRHRLRALGIRYHTSTFVSYFKAINFGNPTEKDKLCLDFFLLDCYEETNVALVNSLSQLDRSISANSNIRHDVGITKICR